MYGCLPFDQQYGVVGDGFGVGRPGKQALLVDDVEPCTGKISAFDDQRLIAAGQIGEQQRMVCAAGGRRRPAIPGRRCGGRRSRQSS